MAWSDRTLNDLGPGVVTPWLPENIQPASIDLRVGTSFAQLVHPPAVPDIPVLDPLEDNSDKFIEFERRRGSILIPPKGFVLGTTLERVKLPRDLSGRVEGKSSIGRLGLLVLVTAGWIDPGFEGEITLEFFNLTDWYWRLHIGMRICQITFDYLTSPSDRPYGADGLGSKYMRQAGATVSKSYLDGVEIRAKGA